MRFLTKLKYQLNSINANHKTIVRHNSFGFIFSTTQRSIFFWNNLSYSQIIKNMIWKTKDCKHLLYANVHCLCHPPPNKLILSSN